MSTQAQQWPKHLVWKDGVYHYDPAATQAGIEAFKAISELLNKVPSTPIDLNMVRRRGDEEFTVFSAFADMAVEIRTGEPVAEGCSEPTSYVDLAHRSLDLWRAFGVSSLSTPLRALVAALTAAVRVEPGMSDYDRLVRLRAHVTEITRAVLDADPDHVPWILQSMGL